MPLSWNEIRARSLAFSKDWEGTCSESAEAKSFWDAFFNVFGVSRRRLASFETPVKKADGQGGFIDLLWKGNLLVEHKSRGKDLDRAAKQAFNYFPGIKDRDLPRFVVVSDFARFKLYDLDEDKTHEFALAELHQNIRLFGFIAGYQTRSFGHEDPVNVMAAEKLGRLHDQLKDEGYDPSALEPFLVRLLFCLFAEDTAIFERSGLQDYVENRTAEDGSDLGMHLAGLFQTLNTAQDKRQANLDEQMAEFPYVNGRLFAESLPLAAFNSKMRETLLDCCALDWSRISPAIFGSLFQSIMDKTARRNLGAHYTSETNILKALRPLFLDGLREEFARCRNSAKKLREFHDKLGQIRVFDPACGCGNFLVVAYRELRELELDVLRTLHQKQRTGFLDIGQLTLLDVDQFIGIEIEEFPAQIAQVALWLTDHQMNLKLSEEFGQYFVRLPLTKSPRIHHGNALDVEWRDVATPVEVTYLVGNPPFVGAKFLNDQQREERNRVFHDTKNAGLLDYVSCWYRKAAEFMQDNPQMQAALVSTNSITQGEQTGVLWPDLFRFGVRINFAHRTFQWNSEARGKAAVHCVIIGFALEDVAKKWIFEYETVKSDPHAIPAANINPYLVDAADIVVTNRSSALCDVPSIGIGNKPIDDGNYLFTPEERAEFIRLEPQSAKCFRRWLGSREFLNGIERWCLWLGDCSPAELRQMPHAKKRINAVRQFRLSSKSAPTKKLAEIPTRFHVENMPESTFLLIPEVSSERRHYIPIGFMDPDTLCSNLVKIVPGASLYHFGVLSSHMHNAWMRAIAGRLKSDYRYSAKLVYNNFPWPEPNEAKRAAIIKAAQSVLDARAEFPDATMADLYDPVTTPRSLHDSHRKLDRAVEKAYRTQPFTNEPERVAFLLARYGKLVTTV
jgi:hypothetical protein